MNQLILRMLIWTTVAMVLFPAVTGVAARMEVVGTTYTSPTYGYTISWADDWFLIEESSEGGIDALYLSDSQSTVEFLGGPTIGVQLEVSGAAASCSSQGYQNCQMMLDENGEAIQGGDNTFAYATLTYTDEYPVGTFTDRVMHIEAQLVAPEISVLSYASVEAASYQGYDEKWAVLLAGISPASEAETTKDPTGTADNTGVPVGAVASGAWRFSVATATSGVAIPSLNLPVKEGRNWVVIVADVLNWSDHDAVFQLRSAFLQTVEMPEPFDLAPSSTKQVAELLALTAQQGDTADIAIGDTARIVLVYSIPTPGTDLDLILGKERMSVDSILNPGFDPTLLPAIAAYPATEDGNISGVFFESTMTPDGSVTENVAIVNLVGDETDYYLAGVESPSFDSCHFLESLELLQELQQHLGGIALLELDPTDADSNSWYVWLVNPDGSRLQLNEWLVEHGAVSANSSSPYALFDGWLEESGEVAQASALGVWGSCGVTV